MSRFFARPARIQEGGIPVDPYRVIANTGGEGREQALGLAAGRVTHGDFGIAVIRIGWPPGGVSGFSNHPLLGDDPVLVHQRRPFDREPGGAERRTRRFGSASASSDGKSAAKKQSPRTWTSWLTVTCVVKEDAAESSAPQEFEAACGASKSLWSTPAWKKWSAALFVVPETAANIALDQL